MSDQQKKVEVRTGFLAWLGLLFIGLKLTGYISWPWVWVLSPLWIPFSVAIVLFTMVGIVYAITMAMTKK
jgi:hypothetical protein